MFQEILSHGANTLKLLRLGDLRPLTQRTHGGISAHVIPAKAEIKVLSATEGTENTEEGRMGFSPCGLSSNPVFSRRDAETQSVKYVSARFFPASPRLCVK